MEGRTDAAITLILRGFFSKGGRMSEAVGCNALAIHRTSVREV